MPLTSEAAKRVIEAAEAKARELNLAISTTIFDAEGRLFAFSRMDSARWSTVEVSQAKAFAAVLFRREGPELQQIAPTTITAMAAAHHRGILPTASATVLREGDQVIGSIGCSGAPSDELDADCAHAGRDALNP